MDWRTLNPRVIAEFRQNAGKVSGFEGLPLILLQTKGARSGNRFDVPLIPVLEDARIFLFGTNAGSPKQPIWALNVLAHPRIVVEYEARIFEAIIEPLSSDGLICDTFQIVVHLEYHNQKAQVGCNGLM